MAAQFSILILFSLILSANAYGTTVPMCEGLFHPVRVAAVLPAIAEVSPEIAHELSRPPDDAKTGFVTDIVPITAENLVAGYSRGVFPWQTTDAGNGAWFAPPQRGVLFLNEIEIGRSDRKLLRPLEEAVARGELRITHDTAFSEVIRECQSMKRFRRDPVTRQLSTELGTWITPQILEAYEALHKVGRAHSIEIWRGDRLVAGSYGTFVNGVFSGESMFHKEDNVAKLLFVYQLEDLKAKGLTWVDTQVAIPGSGSLAVKWGAREVPRDQYLMLLRQSQNANVPW